jgi:DNA (cytosine-5)-methyltransferase 1
MKKVLSLFAGCGGMDLGFEQAGFNVISANEFWEPAILTYVNNFKNTKMISGDITDPEKQTEIVESCKTCDILVGGPPCQAYSLAGRRDPNDPRGRLFETYITIVSMTKPKITVMENVTGILSMKHHDGMIIDLITKRMDEIGYELFYKVLDSSNYGVPQSRRRVILVGIRKDFKVIPKNRMDLIYPEPTHDEKDNITGLLPFATVKDAIDDLADKPENKKLNHCFTKHSKEYIKIIHKTPIGKSVTGYSETCFRCSPDAPSKTVKANNGGVFIHYSKDRCMSGRELARLQGFPDDFLFKGTKGDVLKQIGNAVPPPLAKAIAGKLLLVLTK